MKDILIVDGKEYISVKAAKEKASVLFGSTVKRVARKPRLVKISKIESMPSAPAMAVDKKKRGRPRKIVIAEPVAQ